MAQVANSAEKHVDLSEMETSNPTTIIDDSPSAKRLKQARLPFKPLGPKTQISLTPHGMPKKRKLSDQESPSAKAPKVTSKHQTERVKLDVTEKPQLETGDHDNEVSSSSEAENIPLGAMQKRKALESNILERFIRKSSQEEISSTNEVVDLTEETEGFADISETSTSNLKVASLKKTTKNAEPDIKVAVDVVIEEGNEVQPDKAVKEVKEPTVDNSTKETKTILKNKKDSKVKQAKSPNSDVGTETTHNNSECKTDDTCKLMDVEMKEAKESDVVAVETNTLSDTDVEMAPAQVIQSDTSEAKAETGTEDLEVSAISNKSKNLDKSSDVNTSSSSAKTESDEESSESSGDENNDSTGDVSLSSQGNSSSANTSACKTPMTKGGCSTVTKTPGGSSVQTSTPKTTRGRPKSLKMSEIKSQEKKQEREAMRQRIREQKERERQERKEKKEQERLDAKKKKDEEKAEKERKKNEEKEKKERERREKKEQMDRERIEKQQQKDEEKKKKQEQIDAKIEEKRKKEEEKRLKEEEKVKEEEEKNKKKQKEKQSFTSFFIKKAQQQAKPKETSNFFMDFEVKKDMFLAPPWRRQLGDEDKSVVDEYLLNQGCDCLYVDEVKKASYQKGTSPRTLPRQEDAPELDEEEEVKCVEPTEKKKTLVRHRCKLLQFHTNYRPPYYGTWRKTSTVIKPTKPFDQDTDLFDYEVDSDDEWEEEEPGESVSSSEDEGDEKEEEPEEEEEDGWMVPHGYLSEDEGCDQDEEITPEVLKARQMAKQEAWEAEQKRQKQPVRAIVIGCVWEGSDVAEKLAAKLAEFQAVCLSAVPIDTRSRAADSSSVGGKDGEKGTFGKGNRKPVPEEAMPDLIRLLHGNTIGIKKLIKEFRLYWKKKTSNCLGDADSDNMDVDESATDKNTSMLDESCTEEKSSKDPEADAGSTEGDVKTEDSADGCGMSKRQLEIKIMSIAVREKRSDFKKVCWYVHDKFLKQYNMEDHALPNTWQYVSKGLIRVKNEEACGRKTPNNLSESFTDSVPIIMKEEEESEVKIVKPKDQPSIKQFAKKMQPSELPPPKIRRIELKPASSPTPTAAVKRVESPVADLDSSANEEALAPYKTLPKDQRSIMDFAKKPKAKNAVSVKSGNVKKTVTPQKAVATDLINQNPKTCVPREVTPKPVTSKCKEILPSPTEISPVNTNKESAKIIKDKEVVMDTDNCIILD